MSDLMRPIEVGLVCIRILPLRGPARKARETLPNKVGPMDPDAGS